MEFRKIKKISIFLVITITLLSTNSYPYTCSQIKSFVLRPPLSYGIDIKYGRPRQILSESHRSAVLKKVEEKIREFSQLKIGDESVRLIVEQFRENERRLQALKSRFEIAGDKPQITGQEIKELTELLEIGKIGIEDMKLQGFFQKDTVKIQELSEKFGGYDEALNKIERKIQKYREYFEVGLELIQGKLLKAKIETIKQDIVSLTQRSSKFTQEEIKSFCDLLGIMRTDNVKEIIEDGNEIVEQLEAKLARFPETRVMDLHHIKAVVITGSLVLGKDNRLNIGLTQAFTDESDIDIVVLCNEAWYYYIPHREREVLAKIRDCFLKEIKEGQYSHRINSLNRGWWEFSGLYNFSPENRDKFNELSIIRLLSDIFAIQYCCGELVIDDPQYSLVGIFEEIKERCRRGEHIILQIGGDTISSIRRLHRDVLELFKKGDYTLSTATLLSVLGSLHLYIHDSQFKRGATITKRLVALKDELKGGPGLYELALEIVGADKLDREGTEDEIDKLKDLNIPVIPDNVLRIRVNRLREAVYTMYDYLLKEARTTKPLGDLGAIAFWFNDEGHREMWVTSIDEMINQAYYKEAYYDLMRVAIAIYRLIKLELNDKISPRIENIYNSILEEFGFLDETCMNRRTQLSRILIESVIEMVVKDVEQIGNLPVIKKDTMRSLYNGI